MPLSNIKIQSKIAKAIRGKATEFVNDLRGQATSFLGSLPGLNDNSVQYKFPENIEIDRPLIRFTAYERKTSGTGAPKPWRIYLPAPTNITFNDGADYNNFNLGIMGQGALGDTVSGAVGAAIFNPSSIPGTLQGLSDGTLNAIKSDLSANASEITALATTSIGNDTSKARDKSNQVQCKIQILQGHLLVIVQEDSDLALR